MDDRHIFLEALNLSTPEERTAYLDEACGDDAELRQRVELLLAAHEDAGSFLEKTPEELLATIRQDDDVDLDSWKEALTLSDKDDCLGTLGQYEIRELIGRGGFGVVFSARDPQLNRVVAVKMLIPELATNAVAVRRFLREAEAAAAVSHDHVITIHAIDGQANPPIIVMERIAGQSLQEKIDREGPLDVKSILRIGMQTAAGLAAAHKQGLIHRDIKPSNILLENGVERVKLTDFGLARAVDDIGMTRTGQITGTPQYMSPEQAQGHPIDHRTDLFSLGCVLYAMCTGRAAFRADSAVAVMHRVVHDDPKPIPEVNEDIPEWLCRIVGKLMEKDPSRRFSAASEVEDLLGRHLAHLQQPESVPQPEPVQACAPQRVEESNGELNSASRTLLVAGLASLAFFVLIFLALSNGWFRNQHTPQVALLVIASLLSLPAGLLAMNAYWDVPRRKRYRWVYAAALAAVIPWNPFLLLLLPWTLRTLRALQNPAVRQEFADVARSEHASMAVDSLPLGNAPSKVLTLRRVLAAGFFLILAFTAWGVLEVFDHPYLIFERARVEQLRARQGQLIVKAGYDEGVVIKIRGPGYRATGHGSTHRFVPPGKYLIIATRSLGEGHTACFVGQYTVKLREETIVELEQQLERPGIADFDAIEPFLADSPEIATLHVTVDDPDVRLTINGVEWDIAGKGEQLVPLKPGRYDFLGLEGSVKAFNQAIELKAGDDRSLEFKSLEFADTEATSGKGPQAASAGTADDNEQNSLVGLYSRRPRRKETTPVLAVDVTTDGKWIASGHRGAGDLRLWDVSQQNDSSYVFRAKHGNCSILDVEFSPDDRYVAWVQSNGQLRLRKASSHQITTIDKFEHVEDMFRAVTWSSDGKTILVGGQGKLYLWHIENLEKPILLTVDVPEQATVLDIEWSPRKREFATSLFDGRILIWNAEDVTPTVKTTLHAKGGQPAHEGQAHAVSYSPAGDLLVSCGEDGYVRAWYPESSNETIWERHCSHGQPLLDVQISPDGRLCATGGMDRKLHLFDLRTRESVIKGRIDGTGRTDHVVSNSEITSVCFFHEGPFLLTASDDGVIMWWRYPRSTSTVDTPEIAGWKLRLSAAASIPLDEWNTLSGDVKGPNAAAVRGEPLSLVLFQLNPFQAAKENEEVRQDFWYLTETLPKPADIGKAISISRDKGYVSFLQPEYITNVGADESGGSVVGFAGFTVPKLYSGRVGFKASRIDGKLKITEFTLPNYGIILRPDEQGLWQREISTNSLEITIDQDGNISIQSNRVEWADLDQTLRDRRKSMGDQRVSLRFYPDVPVKKVEETVDLLKKYYTTQIRVGTLSSR